MASSLTFLAMLWKAKFWFVKISKTNNKRLLNLNNKYSNESVLILLQKNVRYILDVNKIFSAATYTSLVSFHSRFSSFWRRELKEFNQKILKILVNVSHFISCWIERTTTLFFIYIQAESQISSWPWEKQNCHLYLLWSFWSHIVLLQVETIQLSCDCHADPTLHLPPPLVAIITVPYFHPYRSIFQTASPSWLHENTMAAMRGTAVRVTGSCVD